MSRTAARSRARAAARLAAVQALYQHEMEGTKIPQLLTEFHHHRLGATIEDVEYADADIAFGESISQICFILVILAVTYFRREISFTPDYADDDDAFDTKLVVTDAATGAQVIQHEAFGQPS